MELIQLNTFINNRENNFYLSVDYDSEYDLECVIQSLQDYYLREGDTISLLSAGESHHTYVEPCLKLTFTRECDYLNLIKLDQCDEPFYWYVDISTDFREEFNSITLSLPLNHWEHILQNQLLERLVIYLENTHRCDVEESLPNLLDYFYECRGGNHSPVVKFTYAKDYQRKYTYCVSCRQEHLGMFKGTMQMLSSLYHNNATLDYYGQVMAYPQHESYLTVVVNASNSAEIENVRPSNQSYNFRTYNTRYNTIYEFTLPVEIWYAILSQNKYRELVDTFYSEDFSNVSNEAFIQRYTQIVHQLVNK